jgi:hypothetical protein
MAKPTKAEASLAELKRQSEAAFSKLGIYGVLEQGAELACITALEAEVKQLREAVTNAVKWLENPDWGKYWYMEGSDVHEHKHETLDELKAALTGSGGKG